MFESFVHSLGTYYGADWLSMLTGFTGSWMVTSRNHWGFLFMIASMLLAGVTAVIASQYGFIFANIISIGIAIRGFVTWRPKTEVETPPLILP